jgi:hypothetical protein
MSDQVENNLEEAKVDFPDNPPDPCLSQTVFARILPPLQVRLNPEICRRNLRSSVSGQVREFRNFVLALIHVYGLRERRAPGRHIHGVATGFMLVRQGAEGSWTANSS